MIRQLFLILILAVDANVAESVDYFSKLRLDIFGNNRIDTKRRPVTNYTESVVVNATLVLLHLYKLDEETGTLVVNGWIEAYWKDPQLTWDPKNYDNITYLDVPDTDIWKPDLTVINSIKHSIGDEHSAAAFIGSDGSITWWPFFVSSTNCPIDHRYFPFDEHTCTIDLGSWSYVNDTLMLQNIPNYRTVEEADPLVRQFQVESPLWKMDFGSTEQANVSYACCPEIHYPFLRHTLRLRRNSPLYKFLFVLPSIMSIFLTLAVFWLPPSAGERITLSGIIIFMQLAMLVALGFTIPQGGKQVPHIVLLCGNSLVMTCLSMLISILVIRLSRSQSYAPLPSRIKDILNGPLGRILFLGSTSYQTDTAILNEENPEPECAEGHEKPEKVISSKTSTFGDWLLLATAIDHFCFILYSIIFALIIIISFA